MKILFRNRAINIFSDPFLLYMLKEQNFSTLNLWNRNHIITIMKTGFENVENFPATNFTNFTTETYLKLNNITITLFVNSGITCTYFVCYIPFLHRATLNMIYIFLFP